jgi:hypothetical protein
MRHPVTKARASSARHSPYSVVVSETAPCDRTSRTDNRMLPTRRLASTEQFLIRRAPKPQKAGIHPNMDFTTQLGRGHVARQRQDLRRETIINMRSDNANRSAIL